MMEFSIKENPFAKVLFQNKKNIECIFANNKSLYNDKNENNAIQNDISSSCQTHLGQKYIYYCLDHQTSFCEECLILHLNDNYQNFSELASKYKDKFSQFRNEFESLSIDWSPFFAKLKKIKSDLENERGKYIKEIENIFDSIIEKIQSKKEYSIKQYKEYNNNFFNLFSVIYQKASHMMRDIMTKTDLINNYWPKLFQTDNNINLIQEIVNSDLKNIFSNYCCFHKNELNKLNQELEIADSQRCKSLNIENNFKKDFILRYIEEKCQISFDSNIIKPLNKVKKRIPKIKIKELIVNEANKKILNELSESLNSKINYDNNSNEFVHFLNREQNSIIFFENNMFRSILLCNKNAKINNHFEKSSMYDISLKPRTLKLTDGSIIGYNNITTEIYKFDEIAKIFLPFIKLPKPIIKSSMIQINK